MRDPYAIDTFITELREQHAKATAEREGEPDGFGVYRTFRFDKASSKTLAKILPVLADNRIASFEEDEGHMLVTFTHRISADERRTFALAEARTVVDAN
jgi:hypothetical protein